MNGVTKIRGSCKTKLSVASILLMPSPNGLTSCNNGCIMFFSIFPWYSLNITRIKGKKRNESKAFRQLKMLTLNATLLLWMIVPKCTRRKFKLVQVLTISTINTHKKKKLNWEQDKESGCFFQTNTILHYFPFCGCRQICDPLPHLPSRFNPS